MSTHPPEVHCVLSAHAANGESPAWSEAENQLYWVDTKHPSLHRFDPVTGKDECWLLPSTVGCAVPGAGGRVLVTLRSGVGRVDCATGELRMLAPVPFDARRFTSNDGKCDPQGRLWFGPMYAPLPPQPENELDAGPLLRFDAATLRCVRMRHEVTVSNGLAWSPDGCTMYHADTKTKTIYTFEFDGRDGTLGERRRFAVVEESGGGGPDGGAMDSEGCYWSAIYGAGKLLRFDPDGKVEREIPMPVRNPTMPAFGGADWRTIYVTTARQSESAANRVIHPHEGGLFAFEAPAPGIPTHLAAEGYFTVHPG